jgi:2-polyprenyl-3-methyl-5-hydroxy-6-metoxy-1,4-benzoquinol methylase
VLCSSVNITAYRGYENVGLIKCNQCKFVFCRDRPSRAELHEYYTDSYERTRYFSPITVSRFNELLEGFEKYRKTGKILDIGSGYGFFLEIARQKGWDVYGTELTDEAVTHCENKGIKMFKGELPNIPLEENAFDVIVAIEALEHVNNPTEYIKHACKTLRKGGLFYITTPNFNAALRYHLKEKYNIIGYPNHLCYFTKRTLKKLFTNYGFKTQKIATTGISLTRLKTSKGKSNQAFVSETSDDEMMRYKIERSRTLKLMKRISNGILNFFKIGDSLKGSFIKS